MNDVTLTLAVTTIVLGLLVMFLALDGARLRKELGRSIRDKHDAEDERNEGSHTAHLVTINAFKHHAAMQRKIENDLTELLRYVHDFEVPMGPTYPPED